jgi:phage shock protein A
MNQIENHDALVQSAIREVQESGVKARIQLGRVQADGRKMEVRLKTLEEQIGVWTERAKRVAADDEKAALECIRRKREAEREKAQLLEQLQQHKNFSENLSKDLRGLEVKLDDLKRKRNAFSAKQHRADAVRAGQLTEFGMVSELDEIFERWEMKLGEYELNIAPKDELAEKFETEEEAETLRAELNRILTN